MLSETMCPVCGYLGLSQPPYRLDYSGYPHHSDEICVSCGFQFGWSDLDQGFSFEGWRAQWIAGGLKFWSRRGAPAGWNPLRQLENLIDPGSVFAGLRPRASAAPRVPRTVVERDGVEVVLIERMTVRPGEVLHVSLDTRTGPNRQGLYVAVDGLVVAADRQGRELVLPAGSGAVVEHEFRVVGDGVSTLAFYNVWDVSGGAQWWWAQWPTSGMRVRGTGPGGGAAVLDCAASAPEFTAMTIELTRVGS